MSVTLAPWDLSNWATKPWVITVIVIVLITWGRDEVARSLAESLTLATALLAYEVQQRGTATTATDPAR